VRVALALVLAALVAATLAQAASAEPGRIAVGLLPEAPVEETAALVESVAGVSVDRSLEPIGALVVEVPDVGAVQAALAALPGVAYVEPLTAERRLLFEPNDPLAQGGPTRPAAQWYLSAVHAFDFWQSAMPALPPVKVAVIDSGIDGTHPEFANRIVAAKSFVGGRADVDTIGHGTLVAGEIAAWTDNDVGIAGIGFPAKLVVAKVVGRDGSIDIEAEAKAIQWAVSKGAKVINLSLGGTRDPANPERDTYSEVEAAAIEWAYGQGAVIVAATGNTDQQSCPYRYASYPAALPHVLGVGAVGADGVVPCFSNRDPRYNDLIAPGVGIVSTFPFALTDPACASPGYSLCATGPASSYRGGAGTSFAAPIVSAAAALLLADDPTLAPSQVMQLLQTTTSGRPRAGRNAVVGNGLLDVFSALNTAELGPLPVADRAEPNDDAGQEAAVLFGARPKIDATIDWYDDPIDVYRVYLRAGRPVEVRVSGLATRATLVLWRPGTANVTPVTQVAVRNGKILAYQTGRNPVLRLAVPADGWYFVQLRASARSGYQPYHLAVSKTRRGR
jgi:subtilisin family serine protease